MSVCEHVKWLGSRLFKILKIMVLFILQWRLFFKLFFIKNCCDVAVAQINYPSFKHNTQDSIEQARGRSHEEHSSQIFMLDDMQFGGGLDVI